MTDWHWTVESLRPLVLETLDIFGAVRAMFASNFPVDGLYSDYDTLVDAYRTITATLSPGERRALFHDNAQRFYRL
jgi:predicted TIM-barrel fold metal-dependent hydrolase